MLFVSVDPGKITGVAWLRVGDDVPQSRELSPLEAVQFVEEMLVRNGPAAIVACESFIPRPGAKTWQPEALYAIGALQYVCYMHHVPFRLQSPASAKGFSTNTKLKKLDWYRPSEGGHENDARRHLLLLMMKTEAIDLEELLDA